MYNSGDKRGGLSDECPFCTFRQNGAKWLKTIRDVNAYEVSLSSSNRIGVASKCPCCERLSWAHYDVDLINRLRYNEKEQNDYIKYYEDNILSI